MKIFSLKACINGNTEHQIIGLLKLDGSLTLNQLYPLLKMSRKGVQKAVERLKAKEYYIEKTQRKVGDGLSIKNS